MSLCHVNIGGILNLLVSFLFIHLPSFSLITVFSMPILVTRGHQLHMDESTNAAVYLVITISRPLARFAFFGSIYMTIVITFERYCGKLLFRINIIHVCMMPFGTYKIGGGSINIKFLSSIYIT